MTKIEIRSIIISNKTFKMAFSIEKINEIVTFYGDYRNHLSINPSDMDWNGLMQASESKNAPAHSFSMNPQTIALNFENYKPFVPDLFFFVGEPIGEVCATIVSKYKNTHYIPGLEYQFWLSRNPNMISADLKYKNYWYITPGSTLVKLSREVYVPFSYWTGGHWHLNEQNIMHKLRDKEKFLLLEK